MPRVAGSYKILEKINDNAYKHELPPEFRVSPTFNIADLKPYLGEEDELESRKTPLQEGEDDEDITPMDTNNTPLVDDQGPITRSRARQLKLQVSSFLCTYSCAFENNVLPNELIILRNEGKDQQEYGEGLGGVEGQQGRSDQGGGPNHSTSFQFRTLGAARRKTDAQATYGVGFGRSIYGWNENFIRFPMAQVSHQNSTRVDGNRQNK